MGNRSYSVIALLALVSISGCTESTTPENVGGETHFLHSCDEAVACGAGLTCVCGVCTKACVSDNSCVDENDNATCEAPGTPRGACGSSPSPTVCDVKCTTANDCGGLGKAFTCESGSCRKLTTGSCVARGVIHADGDQHSPDSCNTCTCNNGNFTCTGLVCMDAGMGATMADATVEAGATSALWPSECTGGDNDAGGAPSELVLRVARPICAGAATTLQQPDVELVGGGLGASRFWLTDTDAYWVEDDNFTSTIARVDLENDRSWSLRVTELGYGIESFSVDGCRMYWSESDSITGRIVTALADGTGREVLAAEWAEQIAVDATDIYLSMRDGIRRMPRTGTSAVLLGSRASREQRFESMIVLENQVLWLDSTPGPMGSAGVVLSTAKAPGAQAITFAEGLPNPWVLAADDTHIYVGNWGFEDELGNVTERSVTRIPLAGETPEIVRATQGRVRSIALDQTHLYWLEETTSSGADLWRAPKSDMVTAARITGGALALRVDASYVYWSQSCGNNQNDYFIVRRPTSSL